MAKFLHTLLASGPYQLGLLSMHVTSGVASPGQLDTGMNMIV
jgi:hypothetical protein